MRKSDSTSGSHGRSPKAAWKRPIWSRGSPLAVGRKRIRGTGRARELQDELVERRGRPAWR